MIVSQLSECAKELQHWDTVLSIVYCFIRDEEIGEI
jgi:hypothetical protein